MEPFAIISMLFVLSGILSAIVIFTDEYILNNRQSMKIMNLVWILTGLWAGVFGLVAYYKIGRGVSTAKNKALPSEMDGMSDPDRPMKMDAGQKMTMSGTAMPKRDMGAMPEHDMNMSAMPMNMMKSERKMWEQTTLSTLHCGAGCTLADVIGECFLIFVPLAIGWGWGLDYLLALGFGVLFQFAAIEEMEPALGKKRIFQKAFNVDFWSLTSWQIGMYGFLAVVFFAFDVTLQRNSWEFWFFMQIAMLCGFVFAYPTNRLLIRLGIKKGM